MSFWGSPPRVRGKVRERKTGKTRRGITPACAGKSKKLSKRRSLVQDHPRVCGEKFSIVFLDFRLPGSPPRVRGKARQRARHRPEPGITPACAGKSLFCALWSHLQQDHPRVCGEKRTNRNFSGQSEGSPPRVRGKVCHLGCKTGLAGITPACAGKRARVGKHWRTGRDHPRVCGEKCFALLEGFAK